MGYSYKRNRYGIFERECPTIKSIVNKISGEQRIMADEVYEMVEHYHKWAVESMSSDTLPNVRVPNFGNFFITSARLRVRISLAIKLYRQGIYSYEKVCELIRRYYPVYKRANFEELRRGRGITRRGNNGKRKSLRKLIGRKMKKDWINT